MIVASIRVRVPDERREGIAHEFLGLVGPTRVEAGCVRCRLYEDIEDRSGFLFVTAWTTRADLDRHLRSETYRTSLALIELSEGPPEIHFDTVQRREGMRLITEARQSPERN